MKFFILTIFCNLLSSGHLQETNNAENVIQQDIDKNVHTIHTIQGTFYGETQKNIPKPCSRRSNSESETIVQQFAPTLKPKAAKPVTSYDNLNIKSQLLRNKDQNSKQNNNQQYVPSPPLYHDERDVYKAKNALGITNPHLDSDEILEPRHEDLEVDHFESELIQHVPSNDFHSPSTNEIQSVPKHEFDSASISSPHSVPHDIIDFEQIRDYHLAPASELHSDQSNQLSLPSSEYHPIATKTINSEPKKQAPVDQPDTVVSTLTNKCSDTKQPDDLVGHSRRSMSNYNDNQGVLRNDQEQTNIDSYNELRISNENAMASVFNSEPNYNTQKVNQAVKDQNLGNVDKSKSQTNENHSYQSVTRVGRPQFNEARRELIEPTKGAGVSNIGKPGGLMLLQTERICYACSTANNPTCWAPDRRTTVKYCRKGNNACITKTFGSGSAFTLIRDCGRSCDDSEMGGLMPRYKSCSMCHSELCNGAYSINGHSIIFALFLIALIKYLN